MSSIKRGMGWHPSKPDQRDHLFTLTGSPAALPKKVDLRPQDSPIDDQLNLGSCTSFALCGALQFLEKKDGLTFVPLSELFLYYDERVIENSVASDSGAELRDGIKTLAAQGVPPLDKWPYDVDKFTEKPSDEAYKAAAEHVITSYASISDLNGIKASLAQGLPVVFGFTAYESLESESTAQTGVVPMPQASESVIGGHAIMAIGYNDNKQWVIFRNSWASSWGAEGYGFMPYSYFTAGLTSDYWNVSRGTNL